MRSTSRLPMQAVVRLGLRNIFETIYVRASAKILVSIQGQISLADFTITQESCSPHRKHKRRRKEEQDQGTHTKAPMW